jgi:hypothetical protein
MITVEIIFFGLQYKGHILLPSEYKDSGHQKSCNIKLLFNF